LVAPVAEGRAGRRGSVCAVERWERFRGLATVESRDGALPRGNGDAMRGVRGALAGLENGEWPLPSTSRCSRASRAWAMVGTCHRSEGGSDNSRHAATKPGRARRHRQVRDERTTSTAGVKPDYADARLDRGAEDRENKRPPAGRGSARGACASARFDAPSPGSRGQKSRSGRFDHTEDRVASAPAAAFPTTWDGHTTGNGLTTGLDDPAAL